MGKEGEEIKFERKKMVYISIFKAMWLKEHLKCILNASHKQL